MQILVGNAAVSTSETFIYNHLKIRQSRYRRQKSRYCLKFFSELHPKNGFNQIYQTIGNVPSQLTIDKIECLVGLAQLGT